MKKGTLRTGKGKGKGNGIIELKHVKRTYEMGETEVVALRDANIVVNKGDFVAIMGPSGSGKSTLMHIVGCLDIPDQGEVKLENINLKDYSESDLSTIRGKEIGFVFQTFNLVNTLTALENVELPMIFQDVPKEKRIERAKKLLADMGLGDRINHRPSELSGGQQQRVALARALANDPAVILADEPTGNLDSKTGETVMKLLEDLNRKGKTIIVVTHDPKIAEHAHRIIYIKDGVLK